MRPTTEGWYLIEKITHNSMSDFHRFVRYWDGEGWKSTTSMDHQTNDENWRPLCRLTLAPESEGLDIQLDNSRSTAGTPVVNLVGDLTSDF